MELVQEENFTAPEKECKCCLDNECDVEYRLKDSEFKTFHYCWECTKLQLRGNNDSWTKWLNLAREIDCLKGLRNLIDIGIPLYFRDAKVENNTEIYEFRHNGIVITAKLQGVSFDEDTREKFNRQLLNLKSEVTENKEKEDILDILFDQLLFEYGLVEKQKYL